MKRFRLGGEDIEPENVSMANVLVLLSRGDGDKEESSGSAESSPSRVFECKTCNRQFPSFQALGGHRASHKKPRLATGSQSSSEAAPTKPKVHECSICGLEFAIGQALGGHMRRHRAAAVGFGYAMVEKKPHGRRVFCFDLNLLPSENEIEIRKMGFQSEVVDKTALVECTH